MSDFVSALPRFWAEPMAAVFDTVIEAVVTGGRATLLVDNKGGLHFIVQTERQDHE